MINILLQVLLASISSFLFGISILVGLMFVMYNVAIAQYKDHFSGKKSMRNPEQCLKFIKNFREKKSHTVMFVFAIALPIATVALFLFIVTKQLTLQGV